MKKKSNIFVLVGSASSDSSNLRLVQYLENLMQDGHDFEVFSDLKELPHFDPELSISNTPESIIDVRKKIEKADGVLICTPEYVFSIPSGLKNVIEWCISTTVFSNKPSGIITASTSGIRAHEELQIILITALAKFTSDTTLLIDGVRSKVNKVGKITDVSTEDSLMKFADRFSALVKKK
jgi:chromate reductase, NAD(P)H dehydrogenase (quinone)